MSLPIMAEAIRTTVVPIRILIRTTVVPMNVGYFGHGRFGHGHFGQDISATDISAMKNVKGGRFGHNHKFMYF